MCARHVNHWLNRKLYIWLGLLWWIGVAVALAIFADNLPKETAIPVIGATVFGALLWLVVGLILAHGAIRAAEIRESGMELANVNKEFAQAWRMHCEAADSRSRPKMHRRSAPARPAPPWATGRSTRGDSPID
jgi:hypothetical protein